MTKSILARCATVAGVMSVFTLPASVHADQCHVENVRLLLGTYEMKLVPIAPRCVTANGSFTIVLQLTGNGAVQPGIGDVTVHEKNEGGVMLRGTNDPDPLRVVVEVSDSATGDEYVPYYVTVRDVGKLDPLVRVIGDSAFLSAQWSALSSMANVKFGLDEEEFLSLLSRFAK